MMGFLNKIRNFSFKGKINAGSGITSIDVYKRQVVPLINKDITFKRNVLTTITIKVKDTSMNNKIDTSQESGEMTQGENLSLIHI